MKLSNTIKTFSIAALALAIAPTARAQVNKGCNNATLQGTFAYTVTGSFVAAPAPLGPYAEAGSTGTEVPPPLECQIRTAA